MALSYTVRDRMLNRYIQTIHQYIRNVTGNKGLKTVAYLSAEFLLGPHLGNNLVNLSIVDEVRDALAELDFDLDVILDAEGEPGLGNGGLGKAGRMLPRFVVHPGGPCGRIWDQVRVWYLRPGHPRWVAGRGDRQMAVPWQPLGDTTARDRLYR